ncbi:head completion/stabilization protein [Marinobacter sp. 1-3A]|uniref:head completion/stabilization protein n=1 Tax=Marinobacter sp. 1-3A TaxID=2582920 RepID=UPI001905B3FC|nr:head completion/stabilization protein [Marinobacter sp. 1-3A]MBK1874578.1 head completion/stabilization protein [Marinobacter sp. 1-3A]
MSLIAAGGTTAPVTITNAPFFPDLSLVEFRDSMRLDGTVTDARAVHALEAAMFHVNGSLSVFMKARKEQGFETLEDVPDPDWQPLGTGVRLYLRAVWCLAKADLIERYRDYDATGSGHDQADGMDLTSDDLRRNASWALSDILGHHRTTVELI